MRPEEFISPFSSREPMLMSITMLGEPFWLQVVEKQTCLKTKRKGRQCKPIKPSAGYGRNAPGFNPSRTFSQASHGCLSLPVGLTARCRWASPGQRDSATQGTSHCCPQNTGLFPASSTRKPSGKFPAHPGCGHKPVPRQTLVPKSDLDSGHPDSSSDSSCPLERGTPLA